jgi:metal-responsive CopG/Arc/MetJ family transcriptional regulator
MRANVSISIDKDLLRTIDEKRGLISRSRYVESKLLELYHHE